MKRLLMILLVALPATAGADLYDYINTPDGSYGYKITQELKGMGGVGYQIELTSQTWRGIVWKHELWVARPDKLVHPDAALMIISGGRNRKKTRKMSPQALAFMMGVASKAGCTAVLLRQVPNQPLMGGRFEDGLIAHTFDQYLKSGDETWPLLFPMVKSAVRAMDAVADLSKKFARPIGRFCVTGGSKRGWTTWLTAAADRRVVAIAPMVIDTLNLAVQMRYQLRAWGKYSAQIGDYTKINLQKRLKSDKLGKRLLKMVDPYYHRARITVPKLIVIATNDRYWPVDAVRHYFDELVGPSYIHYVPNAGHGMNPSIVTPVSAFFRRVLAHKSLPRLSWKLAKRPASVGLSVMASGKPTKVELWQAESDTRDFRNARWASKPLRNAEGVYATKFPRLNGGKHQAFYVRFSFAHSTRGTMHLSTPMNVVGPLRNSADEIKKLHALFDAEWERSMRNWPTWASNLGDRRYNDKWPDRSMEAILRDHQQNQGVLRQLGQLDRKLLVGERTNYDLFKKRYESSVAGFKHRQFLTPVGHRGGIQTADDLSGRLRFTKLKDYQDWIDRLEAFGSYMDQTIALMRQGIKEGRVPPRIVMQRVPSQVAAQLVKTPSQSPFYAPLRKPFPAAMAKQQRDRLRAAAQDAIGRVVLPAFRKFSRFFNEQYLPACRTTIGAWAMPDGKGFYKARVRKYTTTELTPEQIHQIGLDEVKRIRKEMQKIIRQVKFKGSFAEFLQYLRTDKRFYFKNKEELLAAYRETCKRIDPALVKLFRRLPRMPYGVKAIPDAIAPHTTTAYYSRPAADGSRAGYFFANLYRPEVRPKYEIEVLTTHEAMPGHHLQIALAMELGELPRFRRYSGFTAFVEGWGLYSESLGEELGLYKDPYSKFGQLTYEMWRAIRLVVDTGIHYFKWERQRAIDYFKQYAAKTEHDIVNEVDRYIGWPGQALAYKIGELKIKQLRRLATEQLGQRFDIRTFHEVVLGSGAVPLDMLEQNIRTWIKQTLAKKKK